MAKPLVSVVMSAFNEERFIGEAVESILGQSFEDFELIVIDDGSTDRTGKILDAYASTDARICFIPQRNSGLISSLNRGCGLATGEYIARMDGDDISMPERLLRQLAFMESHPEVGALGGQIEFMDERGRIFEITDWPLDHVSIRMKLLQGSCPILHPSVLMRRSVFFGVGGYRAAFVDAEDYDLWLRISTRSRLANLDHAVLKYRHHPGQTSQRKLLQQAYSGLAARQIALWGGTAAFSSPATQSPIGPADLLRLGVSAQLQEHYLAGRYENWIVRLMNQGDFCGAMNMAMDMFRFSKWKLGGRSAVANVRMDMASLYWRQGRWFESLTSMGQAMAVNRSVSFRLMQAARRRLDLVFGQAPRKQGTA